MKKKKLLITGGLGNLGSWLTEYAMKYFDVTVLTRKDRDVKIKRDFKLILADLSDEQAICEALKGKSFHYVIHAGSVNDAFVDGYMSLSYKVNSFGTRNLIKALNLEILEHFIYLSTFQVYGVYGGLIKEETKTLPKNDYGLSHLLAEHFIEMDMPAEKYSIIRLTNCYGCPKDRDSSKWYLITNDLARSAFLHREIKLGGNGKALRDFIWSGDVSEALLNLLTLKPLNEVYNFSQEKTLSMYQIAEIVQIAYQELYGRHLPIYVNESDKSSADPTLVVSSSKIKQRLRINYQNKLVEESKAIFKLLENKN
jgi:UDP-glucose 4-epimerase